MALIVYYKNKTIPDSYHCEDKVSDIENIVKISADSSELDLILNSLTNIPYSKSMIQTWYGDMAKFIAANYNLKTCR